MSATLLYLLSRNYNPAVDAAEARGRSDGFLDADGFFTQSDEAFARETNVPVEWTDTRLAIAA